MSIELTDGRQLSDVELGLIRRIAIRGIEQGFQQNDMAELLGVCPETVCLWNAAYRSGGVDALPKDRTGRPPGTGCRLSQTQVEAVCKIIDEKAPSQAGIAAPLWNRRAVQTLILREFRVFLALPSIGVCLRRWGYSFKRPSRKSAKSDPEEQRVWLEETYPALVKQAQHENAEILFCDESGVAGDAPPQRGYAMIGKPPILLVPNIHIRMNVISAMSAKGTFVFQVYKQSLDGLFFIGFLERLIESVKSRIFLIVDRLRAHTCADVAAWIEAHNERIKIILLPRYSPELDPVEYLNNDIHEQATSEGLPETGAVLEARLNSVLELIKQLPGRIMSYFKHPCARYAINNSV